MTINNLTQYIIDETKKRNIKDVDVFIEHGESFQVNVRNQSIEEIENSIEKGLGLRLFNEGKTAFVHTTDLSKKTIDELIEIGIHNLKVSDTADYNILPDKKEYIQQDLELHDPNFGARSSLEKIELAKHLESLVLDDKRISNSNGSTFSESESSVHYANSKGVDYHVKDSVFGLSVSPVVGNGDAMQTNYWYSYARHFSDLEEQKAIAEKAVHRTVRIQNAQKLKSCEVPVIFENSIAGSLLSILVDAIDGQKVFKKQSFLAEKLNQQIGSEHLNIIENPFIKRGIGSDLVDGEGNPHTKKHIVQNGNLTTFLHNNQSAFKMNTESTGNATRSYNSTPSIGATNICIENGAYSLEELISQMDRGLFITGLLGSGLNPITGDFSRGAEGLWIENGKIQYPVNEITVAGNIVDMFKMITHFGNDTLKNRSTASPSFLVEKLTISGK